MKRHFKRFLYLLLFVAFWAGVIFGVRALFFIAPASCFDARQNQGEEGIDCGGPCKRFCLPTQISDITVEGSPRVFRPIEQLAVTYLSLRNANQEIGSKNLPYTIILRDRQGTEKRIQDSTYIYPGEIKNIVVVENVDGLVGELTAELNVTTSTVQWLPRATFNKPSLRVRDSITSNTVENGVQITGNVVNDDPLDLVDVTVIALLYNNRNVLQGVSQTVLPSLGAGETSSFSIAYPPIQGIDPGATQIIVTGARP